MSGNPFDRFKQRHDFLVGIDSDGCAFDTMEVKHKECFIPNTIRFFDLQPISKYAREAAEFVNLYSKWRGINRFPALTMTLDLLRDRARSRATRRADRAGWPGSSIGSAARASSACPRSRPRWRGRTTRT